MMPEVSQIPGLSGQTPAATALVLVPVVNSDGSVSWYKTTMADLQTCMLGAAITDLVAFFGGTKVAQPAAAAQTALTDSTGGTPSATLAAITAGGSYAQADMVAVKNALSGIAVLLNRLRADMVTLNLIKGAA